MGRTSEGSEYEKNCMMSRIKDVQKQLVQKLWNVEFYFLQKGRKFVMFEL